MDADDVLHILIKDLVGVLPDIELYDKDGNVEDATPITPVALPATDILITSFSANWESITGVDGYYLDVSTNIGFTSFLPGYTNLDVGNVLTYSISGLTSNTAYYYRISTYKGLIISTESNVITTTTLTGYGLLYNRYAVTDVRNIANVGWHVPTDTEWKTLEIYIGMLPATADLTNPRGAPEGGELKETGLIYWNTPNTGATNIWGFNVRGGGRRDLTGFTSLKMTGLVWSSSNCAPFFPTYGWIREFNYGYSAINRNYGAPNYGGSVRLVNDIAGVHGTVGTYTGNDGKVYRTICIGTQIWTVDNLEETLYRDLTPIPEVTDGATWLGLITGALCAYNNDWNNV